MNLGNKHLKLKTYLAEKNKKQIALSETSSDDDNLKGMGFSTASNLLSKKLSQMIIKESLQNLNTDNIVFTSINKPNDNMVDLASLF